jgi:hypothetical protein
METYTLKMRCDGGGSETTRIEADNLDKARDLAKGEVADWIREGDWGDSGASVSAWYTLIDEDGETVVDDEGITVEIEPDHDALIRAAGGDPDCDHDWTSEGEGGCNENPGVWSVGGTALMIRDHCRKCGLRRREHYTGSQQNPGEHDTVTYEQPETWCPDCECEECVCEPTATYYVESYGADGCHTDPQLAEHDTLAEALEDVADRLGREIDPDGEWTPDEDMAGAGIPNGARPVGAWNDSDEEGCGGVALWKVIR